MHTYSKGHNYIEFCETPHIHYKTEQEVANEETKIKRGEDGWSTVLSTLPMFLKHFHIQLHTKALIGTTLYHTHKNR